MPDFKEGVLVERFRGYGQHWLEGEEPASVWAGPPNAASSGRTVLRMGLLAAVHGRGLKTWTSAYGSGRRRKFYWIPSVTMYALDCNPANLPSTGKGEATGRSWGFQCKWSQSLSEMPFSGEMTIMQILMMSHGHPAFSIGGAEVASYNLFRSERPAEIRCHYLARVGPPIQPHRGTPFMTLRQKEHETLMFANNYDYFRLSNRDLDTLSRDFCKFVDDVNPGYRALPSLSRLRLGGYSRGPPGSTERSDRRDAA